MTRTAYQKMKTKKLMYLISDPFNLWLQFQILYAFKLLELLTHFNLPPPNLPQNIASLTKTVGDVRGGVLRTLPKKAILGKGDGGQNKDDTGGFPAASLFWIYSSKITAGGLAKSIGE